MTNQQPGSSPYGGAWGSAPTSPPPIEPDAPMTPPTMPPVYGTVPPGQFPPASATPTPKPREPKARTPWVAVVVTGIVCTLVAALVAGGLVFVLKDTTASPRANGASSAPVLQPGDIQAILAKEQPAVVSIWTGPAAASGSIRSGGSAGTGFVVTTDGYIVTNNHVIESANGKIAAVFNDGKVRTAELIGADPAADIAVIKVDAQNLASSTLGSSAELKVGDDVVAIGNALALDGGMSVTRGIVSAKGRSITTETGETLDDLIQTDAAINQGNSGGPLVNSDGDVVGINVAGVNPSLAQNISFAISIDSAKPIIDELKAGKDRRPGFLGVRTQTLTPSIASQIGTQTKQGVVIVNTTVDSPAEKAGLRRYDVITELNGKPVTNSQDMTAMVAKMRPGDKASITYERDGEMKTVEVTLAVRPS